MVATLFPTFQSAVDARNKTPEWLVLIDGYPTEVVEWSTRHGVHQPVGTATLILPPGDLPEHVTIGASVVIQAGYKGVAATVFQGFLPQYGITWSDDGTVALLNPVGYGDWLARRDYATVRFPGPVAAKTLYQSLASRRGVPSAWADNMTAPDGATVIEFGGNADYENGDVLIPRKTESTQWLNQLFNLFGHYVFDLPSGPNRMQGVYGLPNKAPVATFEQGVTGYRYAVRNDQNTVVTYWEVKGARYTESETNENVEIRSIPAVVPFDPLLGPDGYVRDERSHNQLVSVELADIVRNVLEIDYSEPRQIVTWEDEGSPHIQPGDVAHVTAPALNIDADLWVMSVVHRGSDRNGLTTDFEGWAGSGEALPPGEDCITQSIYTGPVHLGDETIPWYAVPTASPATLVISFTAADDYTSILITCEAHGCNSYMLTGRNADSTVTRFEVWQFGEKIGEGQLPVLDENFTLELDYGDDDHPEYWTSVPIAIPGRLKAGPAEVRIVPGRDTRLPWSTGLDDCEIRNVNIRTCGIGEPVIGEVTT